MRAHFYLVSSNAYHYLVIVFKPIYIFTLFLTKVNRSISPTSESYSIPRGRNPLQFTNEYPKVDRGCRTSFTVRPVDILMECPTLYP